MLNNQKKDNIHLDGDDIVDEDDFDEEPIPETSETKLERFAIKERNREKREKLEAKRKADAEPTITDVPRIANALQKDIFGTKEINASGKKEGLTYTEKFQKELKDDVNLYEQQIFQNMTMIRYKYEYYEFQSLVINIIIILCSSVITFLESLRANISQDDNLDFWFNIVTLSLGFIIAFSLSFYKFLKIQDKMEITKSAIIGLEAPYKELCEFINESQTYFTLKNKKIDTTKKKKKQKIIKEKNNNGEEIEVETDEEEDNNSNPYGPHFNNDKELSMEWEKIRIKSVHPCMNADNIIKSGEYCNYEKRYQQQYMKTKKQRDKMELQKLAHDNLLKAKTMIMEEMIKDTEYLYDKYGNVKEMKRGNDLRLQYWNEGVIMSNKLQERYNKLLGIKSYDKCCDTCVDVYCCCCNAWCKKFFKSLIYFLKCCCPNCCFRREKRNHRNYGNYKEHNTNGCCFGRRKQKNESDDESIV